MRDLPRFEFFPVHAEKWATSWIVLVGLTAENVFKALLF
jgi:hypothetical protein